MALAFFMPESEHLSRQNMSLLSPGSYSIGAVHSSSLYTEERVALHRITRTRINQILAFQRIFTKGTIIHSVQYGRQEGKRDSTICSFKTGGSQAYGVVQKFCIIDCLPINVALIKPFEPTNLSILHSSGRPGREILSKYAQIAVPISDILCKMCKGHW